MRRVIQKLTKTTYDLSSEPSETQKTHPTFDFVASRWVRSTAIGLIAMILEEDVTAFWLFNVDSTTSKIPMSK